MTQLAAQFAHLVDDAAIFPPGNLPLDKAVVAHREHLGSDYAGLLGPFVVSDTQLPDLIPLLDARLAISVVVSGGAGAVEGSVKWASRAEHLDLRAIEFALRDEDDLAHNAKRVIAMLDTLTDELGDANVYVEPPRLRGEPTHGWLSALDELAARELPLKFRTGGVNPGDVPSAGGLAACIDAALDRELRFKCTAGLHRAIRHTTAGGVQHGFLNVLVATVATLDGNDPVAVLEETDPGPLVELARAEGERARRWFASFGSCSIAEPYDDLNELELLR